MSKVTFKNYWLVNKLKTGLVMKAGYISIKVGGFAKVMEADLEHPDVVDAINKEWVEVHSQEPDSSVLVTAPAPIIETDGYRGMTADELKASTEAEQPATTAKTEALGRDGVEATGEATSTAIGKTAEEANTGKRGRKAAAE